VRDGERGPELDADGDTGTRGHDSTRRPTRNDACRSSCAPRRVWTSTHYKTEQHSSCGASAGGWSCRRRRPSGLRAASARQLREQQALYQTSSSTSRASSATRDVRDAQADDDPAPARGALSAHDPLRVWVVLGCSTGEEA
jgi:hypothetical protein